MNIVLAGGGTAGHINPALAIAQTVLQNEPDSNVLFVGNRDSLEEKLVTRAGFAIRFIKIQGLDRKKLYKNVTTLRLFVKAVRDAKEILRAFKPDVVVGTGGYVSGPVLYAATQLGLRTCIHEQNAYPGITSKMLSARVDKVFISFADSARYFKKKEKLKLTGNPLRAEFETVERAASRRALGLRDDEFYVLSFGGSLGATALNRVMTDVLARNAKTHDFVQCHAMGRLGADQMPQKLREMGVDIEQPDHTIRVREYIYDMPKHLAAADVVICRAGAITLGEIMAGGKAAILIPSPNVTHNHQYYNAMSMKEKGAAILLEEKDLTAELLYQTLLELKAHPERVRALGDAAGHMALRHAAQTIYKELV